MLYAVMYRFRASEALGLPLCIIFTLISSLRLDFECSDGCFLKSTSFAQRGFIIEISCCVVKAPSKERVRSDSSFSPSLRSRSFEEA